MVHKSLSNLSEGPFFKDLKCVFDEVIDYEDITSTAIEDLLHENYIKADSCIGESVLLRDSGDGYLCKTIYKLEYWLKVIACSELSADITEKLLGQNFQCDEQQYQDLLHAANAFASAFVKWSLEPYYKDSDIQNLNRRMCRLKNTLNGAPPPETDPLQEKLTYLNLDILSTANAYNYRTHCFYPGNTKVCFEELFQTSNDCVREKRLYVKSGFKTHMNNVDEEAYVNWWKSTYGPLFDFFRNFEKTLRVEYKLNEEVRKAYKDVLIAAEFLMPEQHSKDRIEALCCKFEDFSALEWNLHLPM